MRADEKNLRMRATNFRLDIVAGSPVQIVTVAPRLKTGAGKRILDEIGSRVELRIARHISLANLTRERLHIGNQFAA